jgi:endonuclease/exonuclease/phosphatase family metal-dependent hydrolase
LGPEGQRRAVRVRVVTLNVWNDEGDSERRARIINRGLAELRPDLLALQEVIRAGDRDQLGPLLEGLELHATHQADVASVEPPAADRAGGNAVATRWPHRIVEALDLRQADAPDVPWATLAARVEIPDLGELLLIAPTTSWRPDAEAARERQAVAIADVDARHRAELPTVIAGDFTAAPASACIRFLSGLQSLSGRSVDYHDAWAVAGDGPGFTWTSDNPNARAVIEGIVGAVPHHRRIDYIFIGSKLAHPNVRVRVLSARRAFDRPVDGVWASDHFGVVAELEIERDGPAQPPGSPPRAH